MPESFHFPCSGSFRYPFLVNAGIILISLVLLFILPPSSLLLLIPLEVLSSFPLVNSHYYQFLSLSSRLYSFFYLHNDLPPSHSVYIYLSFCITYYSLHYSSIHQLSAHLPRLPFFCFSFFCSFPFPSLRSPSLQFSVPLFIRSYIFSFLPFLLFIPSLPPPIVLPLFPFVSPLLPPFVFLS